jgi:hypothetical protein
MATTYRVLGQVNPSATTNTTLYTVPGGTNAVVSTIVIANLGGTTVTYRIAVRPAGAVLANQHYIAYDTQLLAATAQTATLGLTLAATDVITVYASNANAAFSAFGSEIA